MRKLFKSLKIEYSYGIVPSLRTKRKILAKVLENRTKLAIKLAIKILLYYTGLKIFCAGL